MQSTHCTHLLDPPCWSSYFYSLKSCSANILLFLEQGSISASELATVIKESGQTATEAEVKDMLELVRIFAPSLLLSAIVFSVLQYSNPHPTLSILNRQSDTDGNGTIDFAEFLTMMANGLGPPEPPVLDTFKKQDKKGSGKIPAAELRTAMVSSLGDAYTAEQIEAMITKNGGADGDGNVNYLEFAKLLRA